MEHLLTSESLISLLVLILLEIILGIDNVIFVSIIMGRMDKANQKKARLFWFISGMLVRITLLFGLSWLLSQKGKALFTIPYIDKPIDLASLVMLIGGLFLIYKSVKEIHEKLEDPEEGAEHSGASLSYTAGLIQIVLVDMVFSFDSIITAGGTAEHIEIMILAVIVAMIIMFVFAHKIAAFIEQHPTLKMLALSFLVMIGFSLIVEGWNSEKAHELHLKNYIYFAMAFSFIVELINMRAMKRRNPVKLYGPKEKDMADEA